MRVQITEVGPRDGFQNEQTAIPTPEKIALIDALSQAGLKRIQIASFVHPRLVPQMSDAERVCAGIRKQPDVVYSGLVLNPKGLERLAAAGLTYADLSVSMSDSHSRRNLGVDRDFALKQLESMIQRARDMAITVRVGLQCAFGTHDEIVAQDQVLKVMQHILEIGVDELALADTAGTATPLQVRSLVTRALDCCGDVPLVLHLHDTRGLGLANVLAALDLGCTRFDTAFGGLGGCNFLAHAAGNIATEDTVNLIHSMGYETGVDIARVCAVSRRLGRFLDRPLPGKLYQLDDDAALSRGPGR